MEKVTIPIFVVFLMLVLILVSIVPVTGSYSFEGFDYSRALTYSLKFFDANKCGKDVETNNEFKWRYNCHISDGSDKGIDLSGGYHDDGGYNKTGILQAYCSSILGWSLNEYADVYQRTNNLDKIYSTLKNFSDYIIKCYQENGTIICDVETNKPVKNTKDTKSNKSSIIWGNEEELIDRRVTRIAEKNTPASEMLGSAAASLYMMCKNSQTTEKDYSEKCWNIAEKLYEMAKMQKGLIYRDGKYRTTSYYDDLAWAATCKYLAKPDEATINEAIGFIDSAKKEGYKFANTKVMNWDDMYLPSILVISNIRKNEEYKEEVRKNILNWMNNMPRTKGGLRYYKDEGVLSYSASSALIALVYSKYYDSLEFDKYAKSQIDYILGNNPYSLTYMLGFGLDWPKHPRHMSANGYTSTNNDYKKAAKNLLKGGLVSGPDRKDKFIDDVDKTKYTRVSIDYNTNLIAAFAGLEKAEERIALKNQNNKNNNVRNMDTAVTSNSAAISLYGSSSTEDDISIYQSPSKEKPIIIKFDIHSNVEIATIEVIVNNKTIDVIAGSLTAYNWVPPSNAEGAYYISLKVKTNGGESIISNQAKAMVKYN